MELSIYQWRHPRPEEKSFNVQLCDFGQVQQSHEFGTIEQARAWCRRQKIHWTEDLIKPQQDVNEKVVTQIHPPFSNVID